MPRSALRSLLLLFAAFSSVTPGAAQLPSATPDQAAHGSMVRSIRFDPVAVRLRRGDSATVRVQPLDQDGKPVSDVAGVLFSPNASVVGPQVSPVTDTGAVQLTGFAPGESQMLLLVRVADSSVTFRGVNGLTQAGTLPVTVTEWPVASVKIDPPPYRAYAGTAFRLRAHAITTQGGESLTDTVSWRSTAPGVAAVTADGVVSALRPGQATLVGSAGGVSSRVTLRVLPNPVARISIAPQRTSARTGDVVHFEVKPLDRRGHAVDSIALAYSVSALDSAGATVYEDGAFVAENPGAYRVVAASGGNAAEAFVQVAPRPPANPVMKLGRGVRTAVTTSDLWVFSGKDGRDYAYTGTHAQGGGQRLFAWDVTDPENVVLTDSVVVDARVVNDVKVSRDASWAIITREGASNRRNGIVVLDLATPAHPKVIAELTDSLTGGVHNVWINGNIVYAVNDGTSAMNILDLSDPAHPRNLGRYELRPGETNKTLHDVWADGKYAYLSYWDDGLVILDIGAGTHGGSPTHPTLVSKIAYGQGNTHTAYRDGDYIFVGDEIFGCPACINGPRGYIHVIDVKDLERPKEVARFEVPEAGTHNIWVEDGALYIAYYQGGLRIVDVSGELRGDLYRQGRQLGWYDTRAPEGEAITPNAPMAWGPQLFKDTIFVSDMNSGLWVLRHQRSQPVVP